MLDFEQIDIIKVRGLFSKDCFWNDSFFLKCFAYKTPNINDWVKNMMFLLE